MPSIRSLACAAVAVALLAAGRAGADTRRSPPQAQQLPTAKLSLWLDGFHVRDGKTAEQMEAHHFCHAATGGPIQCALFDGFGPDAKLIGIEYIVDAATFEALPADERRLWHSHVYEVTSGALVAPGMTEASETEFFKKAISTYGKTWHTWDMELSHELPLGRPELMMSFTKDGVLRPELLQERDRQLGTNTAGLREARKTTIVAPDIAKGADRGEEGKSCRENKAPRKAAATPAPGGRG